MNRAYTRADLLARATATVAGCLIAASCGGATLDLDRARDGGGRAIDPNVFLADQDSANLIVVDDTRIFWSTSKYNQGDGEEPALRSCSKDNCAASMATYAHAHARPPPLIQEDAIRDIVVDQSRIFWVEDPDMDASPVDVRQSVKSCSREGCRGEPTIMTRLAVDPRPDRSIISGHLATDGDHLYIASTDSSIYRCPVVACAGAPQLIVANQPQPQSLSLDADFVYWISVEDQTAAHTSILRTRKDGQGKPIVIADNQNRALDLAIDGGFVYWLTSYAAGTISRCPVEGCIGEPELVATAQSYPRKLTVRAGQVFWLTFSSDTSEGNVGSVWSCDQIPCGSEPRLLADQQLFQFGSIAIDERYVWWVRQGPRDWGNSSAGFPAAAICRTLR